MTEKEKRHFIVWFPVLVCFISVAAVSTFRLNEYRQSAFEHISKFCQIVIENSPETETQILSSLKKYQTFTEQEIEGNHFLEQYGYRKNEFCTELEGSFFILSSVLFLITVGCFLVSVREIDRRKQRRIVELTNYLEQINDWS